MAQKKESFFWTSYSDLMTSLFFIMLTLFILVIVLLHKQMEATARELEATEHELEEIKKVEASTRELGQSEYFDYKPEYKKYVLNIKCFFPVNEFKLQKLQADTIKLHQAGSDIKAFLDRNNHTKYLLIIEGQASRDDINEIATAHNYDLSFQRAITLMKFWKENCKIDFGTNCEIQIAGSGDGTLNFGYTGGINTQMFKEMDATLMRDRVEEVNNQRFIIHIIPKNIIER